jgi:hypothetical protein
MLLQLKQRIDTWIITTSKYLDHTEPIFKSNKILPFNDLIKFFNQLLMLHILLINSPSHFLICGWQMQSPGMSTVLFATVPNSRINSWESWFIFNLRKVNTNQYYESGSLGAGITTRYMNTHSYKIANSYNYCTYLNSSLLGAPREYVLHGLVPGLNWAPFWPRLTSMHLDAKPAQYLAVYYSGSSFTPNTLCYLGGFSLMYK